MCAFAANPERTVVDPLLPIPLAPPPRRAKYELQHVVRTNLAANDAAFNCIYETEDETGVRGIRLGKELMSVAGVHGRSEAWIAGPPATRGRVAGAFAHRQRCCVLTPPSPHHTVRLCRHGAQAQHHHAGAYGAAIQRAAAVCRQRAGAESVRQQARAPVRSQLWQGIRPRVHPHGYVGLAAWGGRVRLTRCHVSDMA